MTYTFDTNIVSDLHKDAYGFRPKGNFWDRWNAATDDQKQVIWDGLVIDLEQEIEREKAADEAAVADFNAKVAEIGLQAWVDNLKLSDWELRDPGYICFVAGLPYSMESVFAEIAAKYQTKEE
jgi:hypothetical protein